MKRIIKSLFDFLKPSALNAVAAKCITEEWEQIKYYHEIISYTCIEAEKENLDAIKSISQFLVEKAAALTIENMPAPYRNPKTIETLVLLKTQTNFVHQLVLKNNPDAEIKVELHKLNTTFKTIATHCNS